MKEAEGWTLKVILYAEHGVVIRMGEQRYALHGLPLSIAQRGLWENTISFMSIGKSGAH